MNVKISYGILLVIIAITGRPGLAQVNPLDTENGYRIERIDEVIPRYEKAQENCKENTGITYFRQGWLVRIKDGTMQRHVENITSGTSNDYFIGLQYDDSAWYWNDGTHLTNENWAMNEGDGTDENCAHIRGNNGEWFDVPCDTPSTYICQSDLIYIEVKAENIIAEEGDTIELEAVFATQQDPIVANLYKASNMKTSLANDTTTKGNIKQIRHQINGIAIKDQGGYVFVLTTQDGKTNYNRTAKTNVLVHIPANITDVEPSSIRSPITTGPDSVTCVAEGTPPPTVNWKKSSEVVTSNKTMNGVYQTIEGLKAILHVEYAALTDHGVYTCDAINYVTADEFQRQDSENIALSVLGPPNILSHSGNKCGGPSSITVVWKPNENTRNSVHRVQVTDNNTAMVNSIIINPHGQETITTIMSDNLDAGSTYNVQITVCPDLCIEHLNDTVYVTTAGAIPSVVTNSTVTRKNNACVISWEWKDTYSEDEVSFVVQEKVSSISSYNVEENQMIKLNSSDCKDYAFESREQFYQITRPTEPNRNYTYTITTNTCSGKSEEVLATGDCETEYAAPDDVPPASLLPQEHDLQPIFVAVPDETNGPISCIFVVMVKGENPTMTTNFTENVPANFSDAATNGEPQDNKEYLAAAIQRTTVHESGLTINLGNGKITSCAAERDGDCNAVISIAANWKLQKDTIYTYYIMTSTAYWTKHGTAFQQSSLEEFQIKSNSEYESLGWIAAPVVGGVAVVAIIVGIVYHRKNKSANDNEKSSSTESRSQETNHAYWELPEPGYESVNPVEESSPHRSSTNNRNSPYEPYQG